MVFLEVWADEIVETVVDLRAEVEVSGHGRGDDPGKLHPLRVLAEHHVVRRERKEAGKHEAIVKVEVLPRMVCNLLFLVDRVDEGGILLA